MVTVLTAQQVERLDPAVDALISPDTKLQKVASGFTWDEGPVWIPAGYLLFADIPSNSIRKWSPQTGTTMFLQPSGYKGSAPYGGKEPGSNGMTLDRRGRLTVAGHALQNVWRLETMDPHGQITVLADHYEGKKLTSPNDLTYKSDGSLYFTDPPYGTRTQSDNDPQREQSVNGVYRILHAVDQKPGAAPGNSNVQLLIKELPRPNGIAFSPDEKILYVSNSEPKFWMRYSVKPDGTVGNGSVLYNAAHDTRPGAPDGIKVDSQGDLYGAGPGGVWIFSPEGKHIGTISMPETVGNLAWGDADAKTLYVTASSSVYTIRVNVPGLRPSEFHH